MPLESSRNTLGLGEGLPSFSILVLKGKGIFYILVGWTFFSRDDSLGMVVVPSTKIVINLPNTYKKDNHIGSVVDHFHTI